MSTYIEQLAGLVIGTVESVSPNEIRVLIDTDAPQTTALNAGTPTGFPRINGYVLIPNEAGAVVGLISWLGVEKSPFPKRTGLKDFGLVDLPFPLRKMFLTPVGTLTVQPSASPDAPTYDLRRGVSVFPAVGDQVLLPTTRQLRAIVEGQGQNRRVPIGTSPLAGNAVVSVDPDKLFGRHLAVLGNTGSGKSCSVAGLIRWSLEKADASRVEGADTVNARFIILDPNGEYLNAFSDMPERVRVFQVPPQRGDCMALRVPAWAWDSHEWAAFASAAPGTQRPLLMQALRDLRGGATSAPDFRTQLKVIMVGYKLMFDAKLAQGLAAFTGNKRYECARDILSLQQDALSWADRVDTHAPDIANSLHQLANEAQATVARRTWVTAGGQGYNNFSDTDVRTIAGRIESVLDLMPDVAAAPNTPSEDAPVPFPVENLPDYLRLLAASEASPQIAQFVGTLTLRIRSMLNDRRLSPIAVPREQISFSDWLEEYIGADLATNGQIAVLDLSLVPFDVIHIIIAVVARITFEAVQRYRKANTHELPTILVLEEAHTFVQRAESERDSSPGAQLCREAFERIAREGRKFGLGLVLSSQRPYELSPTVLAQCNTFLLHRLVNDRDQQLVGRLIPDNLGGLLSELPSLPSRQAVLLGWATAIPVLVDITELSPDQRPQSSDPEIWDVWTGRKVRRINWREVAEEWAMRRDAVENDGGEPMITDDSGFNLER